MPRTPSGSGLLLVLFLAGCPADAPLPEPATTAPLVSEAQVDLWLAGLRASSPDARRAAAQALGYRACKQELSPTLLARTQAALLKASRDSAPEVRERAAYALGRLRDRADRAVATRLCQVLQDEDPRVREEAARALSELGPGFATTTAPALGEALGDTSPKVRFQAVLALKLLGPGAAPAEPALRRARQDADPRMRAQVDLILDRLRR